MSVVLPASNETRMVIGLSGNSDRAVPAKNRDANPTQQMVKTFAAIVHFLRIALPPLEETMILMFEHLRPFVKHFSGGAYNATQ